MSDLDRYLTGEVVEKAAAAIQLVVSIRGEIRLAYLPEYEDLPDEHKQQRQHEARRALEAVLPHIIRRAKAEAWEEGAHTAWERSTPAVNGACYCWRHDGEPVNPYRATRIEQGGQP